MASRDCDYRFLQLLDAMASINQTVNLIGVVVDSSIPKKSKGTDCFCTVKIVDESYSRPGIVVNVFAENMEKLPHVESAGDIIQLSHVVMKTYEKEIYILFNKKFSSFALFDGKCSTNFVPYQVSPKFRPREEDKKFIVDLRKWSADYQLERATNEWLSLKEIRVGERINLMCKVLHTYEVTENEWVIFLWDGTDTPPVTVQTKLEDEMVNPIPLDLQQFPLSRDILCTFPAVGTVLRMIVDQGNTEKLGLHLLKTGRWVKFLNIICHHHAGLWRGLLMPFTRLRYLPNDDPLVLQSQRDYEKRVSSKWAWMPLSSIPWPSYITETDYKEVPFVTLMNVLTYPEVTSKFRCVVRVIAAYPWQAEDFRSPLGTYRIRLTLEDPTARIHAFVYAEDGEELFGGYPSVDVMIRKRNKLLGIADSDDSRGRIEDAPRNPPWVQCCIKSYYLDKSDVWGTRNYRIFATKVEDVFLRFINRPDGLKGGPIWNEECLSRRLKQLKQEAEMLEKIEKIEELEETLYTLNRQLLEAQEKMRYYEPNVEKITSLFEAGVYQQSLENAIQCIEQSKVAASFAVVDEETNTDESSNANKNRNPLRDEHHHKEGNSVGPHLSLHFLETQKNWNLSRGGQAPRLNIK